MSLIAHSEKIDTQTVITDHFGRRFVACAGCGKLVNIGLEPPRLLGEYCSFECKMENLRRFL